MIDVLPRVPFETQIQLPKNNANLTLTLDNIKVPLFKLVSLKEHIVLYCFTENNRRMYIFVY
jgi:hypothetical protein